MAEKNIKNTHPKNLGILQFWILHFDFSTLLQAYYPAYPALLAACALVSYPLCSYALVPCALCSSPLRAFVSWWPSVNYAKQSQCQNGQYKHKYSKNKGLCQ
jgi:hypothetical protein